MCPISIKYVSANPTKLKVDSEDAKNWGTAHERSAIGTLLTNFGSIESNLESLTFNEVGLIEINKNLASSPDGLLTVRLTTGELVKYAIEAKCPLFAGNGKPAPVAHIPWKHLVQVLLIFDTFFVNSALTCKQL